MNKAIDIMIPFYANDANLGLSLLRKTIDSVIRQSNPNWAVTVLDNCSPIQGACETVEAYCDKRIRYICNSSNLGLAGNWNECVRQGSAEHYMILHADDELMPNYVEHMIAFSKATPHASAVFCPAHIIDEKSKIKKSFVEYVKSKLVDLGSEIHLQGDEGLASLMRGNFIMAPTALYRRSKVGHIFFDDTWKWIPDFSYWVHLLFENHLLVGTPEVCFRYRRHSQSITGIMTKKTEMFAEESDFYSHVREKAEQKQWTRTEKISRRKSIVKLRTGYFLLHDMLGLDWKASVDKARLLATMRR